MANISENKDYVEEKSFPVFRGKMKSANLDLMSGMPRLTYGGEEKPVPKYYSGAPLLPEVDEEGNEVLTRKPSEEDISRILPSDTSSFSSQAGQPTYVAPVDPSKLEIRTSKAFGGGKYLYDPAQPNAVIRTDGQRLYNQMAAKASMSESSGYFEMDHIVPLWLGGTDTADNLERLNVLDHDKKTKIHNIVNLLYSSVNPETNKPYISTAEAKSLAARWRTLDFNLLKNEKFTQGFLSGDDATAKALAVRGEWDKTGELKQNGVSYDILRNPEFPAGFLASKEGISKALAIKDKWQDPTRMPADFSRWDAFKESVVETVGGLKHLDWRNIDKTAKEFLPKSIYPTVSKVIKGWGEEVIDPLSEIPGVKHPTKAFAAGLTMLPYELPENASQAEKIISGVNNWAGNMAFTLLLLGTGSVSVSGAIDAVGASTRNLLSQSPALSKLFGIKSASKVAGNMIKKATQSAVAKGAAKAGIDSVVPISKEISTRLTRRYLAEQMAKWGAEDVAVSFLQDFYSGDDDVDIMEKAATFTKGAILGGIYGKTGGIKTYSAQTGAMFSIPFISSLMQGDSLQQATINGSVMAGMHLAGHKKLQPGGVLGKYGISPTKGVLVPSRYEEVANEVIRKMNNNNSKIARAHLAKMVDPTLIKKPKKGQMDSDVIYKPEEIARIETELRTSLENDLREMARNGNIDDTQITNKLRQSKTALEVLALNGAPENVKAAWLDTKIEEIQKDLIEREKEITRDINGVPMNAIDLMENAGVLPARRFDAEGKPIRLLNKDGTPIDGVFGYLAPAVSDIDPKIRASSVDLQNAYAEGRYLSTMVYSLKSKNIETVHSLLERQRLSDIARGEKNVRQVPYTGDSSAIILSKIKDPTAPDGVRYLFHGAIGSDHSYNVGGKERPGGLNLYFKEMGKHQLTVDDARILKALGDNNLEGILVDLVPQGNGNATLTKDGHHQLIFKLDDRHWKHALEMRDNYRNSPEGAEVVARNLADEILRSQGLDVPNEIEADIAKIRAEQENAAGKELRERVAETTKNALGEGKKGKTDKTPRTLTKLNVEAPGSSQEGSKAKQEGGEGKYSKIDMPKGKVSLNQAVNGLKEAGYSKGEISEIMTSTPDGKMGDGTYLSDDIMRTVRNIEGEFKPKKATFQDLKKKQQKKGYTDRFEDLKTRNAEAERTLVEKHEKKLKQQEERSGLNMVKEGVEDPANKLNPAEIGTVDGEKRLSKEFGKLSERQIYGNKNSVSGSDVNTEIDGVKNIARKSVEVEIEKLPDNKEGRAKKQKLIQFMESWNKEDISRRALEIDKRVKHDEKKGFKQFIETIKKEYKEAGVKDNMDAPGVYQGYKRLYQTAIYNKPTEFILHTPPKKGQKTGTFEIVKGPNQPESQLEKMIGGRVMTYQDAPNTPDYLKAKVSDIKKNMLDNGYFPIVTEDNVFGIPLTKKITNGENPNSPGFYNRAVERFLKQIGVDPVKDDANVVVKRIKVWNNRQLENPLDGDINVIVAKNSMKIGEMVPDFDKNYKVSDVTGDPKTIKDQMKNASGENGMAWMSPEYIYDVAVGQGRIKPEEVGYLKPTQFLKTEDGKAFMQKFSIQAWTPNVKKQLEKRLGRTLEYNDMVTFNDNVKLGKGIGTDKGSYLELKTPSKSLNIEYNHPHERNAALSTQITSKITDPIAIRELKNRYKAEAEKIIKLRDALSNIKEGTDVNEIWKTYGGKDDWAKELYGEISNTVKLGGGPHHYQDTVNNILNKKINDYLSGNGVFKGDTLKATYDYNLKKNKDGTFSPLNKDEVMISENSFVATFGKDALSKVKNGEDFFGILTRYPASTDSTVLKKKILVDSIHGEKGLKNRVALNPADVYKSNGDFDGDSYQIWSLGGGEGLPNSFGDFFEKRQKGGDFVMKALEKSPANPLGGTDLLNKINAVGEKNREAKRGIASVATMARVAPALVGNKVSFILGKELDGSRKLTMLENGKVKASVDIPSKNKKGFDNFQKTSKEPVTIKTEYNDKIDYALAQLSQASVDAAGTVDFNRTLKPFNGDMDAYIASLVFPEAKDWAVRNKIQEMINDRFQDIYKTENPLWDLKSINDKNKIRKFQGGYVGAEGEIAMNLRNIEPIDVGGRDSTSQKKRREIASKAVLTEFTGDAQKMEANPSKRIMDLLAYIERAKTRQENMKWNENKNEFYPDINLVKKDVENYYKAQLPKMSARDRRQAALLSAVSQKMNASSGENFFIPFLGVLNSDPDVAKTYYAAEKRYEYSPKVVDVNTKDEQLGKLRKLQQSKTLKIAKK